MTRWVLFLAAILVFPVVSSRAKAAGSDQDHDDLKARTYFAAGEYAQAMEIYARLYAETLHPTYLRNIGRCHQNLGNADKAISSFREYLRKARNLSEEQIAEINGYIAEMEALKRSRTAGAASAAAEAPPPAAPAHSPGSAPAAAPAPLPALSPAPTPAPTASVTGKPPGASPKDSSSHVLASGWRGRAGIGLGVASVVALGVGIVYQLVGAQRVDGFNGAGCGNSGGVITGPPECLGRHDEENSAHDLAIAGFASAALFGGAAALLYLTDRGAQSPAERLGVGLTVAGVAALAIGITAQMVTERHISAFNENQCTNNHGTIDGPPTCSSIEDKETLARKVAYSSYAGAALLGLGGAALLVVTSRGADVPSTTSTAIRCVPAIGGSVGASCNMRF